MHFDNPCKPDCPKRTADCHGTCPRYGIWKLVDRMAREADARAHLADAVLSTNNKARTTRWLRKQRNPRR